MLKKSSHGNGKHGNGNGKHDNGVATTLAFRIAPPPAATGGQPENVC